MPQFIFILFLLVVTYMTWDNLSVDDKTHVKKAIKKNALGIVMIVFIMLLALVSMFYSHAISIL